MGKVPASRSTYKCFAYHGKHSERRLFELITIKCIIEFNIIFSHP